MPITALLVANRGEIAVRILRAARELGLRTAAVYSEDDARSPHLRHADEARALRGRGPAAYLDAAQVIDAALASGCDAVHPGYGFLSEDAAFAARCAEAALTFVGPRPELLALFGDKARARSFAEECGVDVLDGSEGAVSVDQARVFFAALPAGAGMMIKAVAGGGGHGVRPVERADQVEEAYARCQSEARAASGSGDVYVERLLSGARHIEVQIAGDGSGAVTHLWERDCTLQRRRQKLVEIAPSPALTPQRREAIIAAAVGIARECRYDNIGTFEFLVEPAGGFHFIEANPRLQVEHTVTEEITGIDLVAAQLRLASGASLAEAGLRQTDVPAPRGFAMQLRVNMETYGADASVRPSGGAITVFEPPSGPGVRVDTFASSGYTASPAFDSLLAKLVVHAQHGGFAACLARASQALREFRIDGLATNLPFLAAIVADDDVAAQRVDTRFIETHADALVAAAVGFEARRHDDRSPARTVAEQQRSAGAIIDAADPLAVLAHGKSAQDIADDPFDYDEPAGGAPAVRAPVQGTIIEVAVSEGDVVERGRRLVVMEAMKMEHVVAAEAAGRIARVGVSVGQAVYAGHPLLYIDATVAGAAAEVAAEEADLDAVRPDLADVLGRHAVGLDAARPDVVEGRRKTGQRTARENIDDLCDAGSFIEYGPLVIAAQRRRRPVDELIARTPADGLVAGIGRVNGHLFSDEASRCIAMSYDYTVLAGTQGAQNHRKKDRMFELAERLRLPIVFFTEGGGGRPGDTDGLGVAGLDVMAFRMFGRLSGLVPLVGITSGRCFAGNAALLGCCDVVIATRGSNIGMGGPAMIEGGGLGVFRPEEVGPMQVQVPNGVVDLPVEDEAAAVRAAKQYLSYFQGATERWQCADQRLLRAAIPENRRRVYDVRRVIETLADSGSVLELRRAFGAGMVTALVRIEGRPLGVIGNNPLQLAGAIDSDGADKAARFMQLCDAFAIPLLFLCDTPGIMVGPEAEKTALVRHAARMFVTGASLSVPFFTIVLRKAYGLGAQAMAGGSFKAPQFAVAWPTGEFGGMGLEGAVKLGYRNELAAVDDPAARRALFDEMVERMYQHGKALNTASHFELDDVIDPMESRAWISAALRALPPASARSGKRRPCIDTW
ncbi:MAG: carbamoyl-phosphate synthase large subunit [Dehalococcoidia bacterium]|nr:carbamoyl-phosphate synthase large subunit [Dehalococcoidia bacterium]